ncbi:MAG: biosynthetic arginine decarboxylase [Gammaproteobacteria bacterium]
MSNDRESGIRQTNDWSAEDASALYRIPAWGKGYFEVSENGNMLVRPDPDRDERIDLLEVVEGLRARDLNAPLVIRFSDILAHRLRRLRDAFANAIDENDYRGKYAAVYPIKVNQQRLVVEEVYRYGQELGFGLEVGSKPELLAVMALTEGGDDRLIVCNGFKDDSYIKAVILAAKLGRTIIPVVENTGELELILKYADRYGVRPRIGVRVKLASEGAGRWRESAGAKSKFGLFVSEILELLDTLTARNMQDCLQLVHCHPGSQLHDIRKVKDTISELAHVYAELASLGAGLRYIDVGGGLGVDYDGSATNLPSSMNYTVQEYARDVVHRVAAVCDARGLEHPTIVSESGRAIAAYSSVLIFNVLGVAALDQFKAPALPTSGEDLAQPIRDLCDAYQKVTKGRLVECYHDARHAHTSAMQMFQLGYLTLRDRGLAEQLFWATCALIRDHARQLQQLPEELSALETILSDIYFCNVSVFQSLPDSWAIEQLFPVAPIHRLHERPGRRAVLADITCDSDGKIDRFIGLDGVQRTLPVHDFDGTTDYYLGAFLVGAYQETLGDLHNLFGDTHVVHVRLHDEGGWWIEETIRGESANEVLAQMKFDVSQLPPRLTRDCERAVRDGRLTLAESQELRRYYETELSGYTYLEGEEPG